MRHIKAAVQGAIPGCLIAILTQLHLPGVSYSINWPLYGLRLGIGMALVGFVYRLMQSRYNKTFLKYTHFMEYFLKGFWGSFPGTLILVFAQILTLTPKQHVWGTTLGFAGALVGLAVTLFMAIRRRRRDVEIAKKLEASGYNAKDAVIDIALYYVCLAKIQRNVPNSGLWRKVRKDVLPMAGMNGARHVWGRLFTIAYATDVMDISREIVTLVSEVTVIVSAEEEAIEHELL